MAFLAVSKREPRLLFVGGTEPDIVLNNVCLSPIPIELLARANKDPGLFCIMGEEDAVDEDTSPGL